MSLEYIAINKLNHPEQIAPAAPQTNIETWKYKG